MIMRNLLLLIFTLCTFQAVSQKFISLTISSHKKMDKLTKVMEKETNIFNISVTDGILVHNKLSANGESTAQIYRLLDYNLKETNAETVLTLEFKSQTNFYTFKLYLTDYLNVLETPNYTYPVTISECIPYSF